MRIMTYNIHKGIGGLDRKYQPDRIVDTIAHYDPDIVLMQEVDSGVPRSRKHHQVDWIGDRLDYPHRSYQVNVRLKRGGYGNAILSRYPIVDSHSIDLTIPVKKRRRALIARCQMRWNGHHRSIVVVNVHLGLAGFERNVQIRKLLRHGDVASLQRQTPCIIGGDFNDVWHSMGKKLMEQAGFVSASRTALTFPAAMPVRMLDGIFYRGDLRIRTCLAGRTHMARQASDHLPLVAEFLLDE